MMIKRLLALAAAGMLALSSTAAQAEFVKHQRVYGILDAKGQVQILMDQVHLENRDREMVLEDQTRLTEIENVGGSESFSINGTSLVWQAEGRDIVYQGTGTDGLKAVPQISFFREGKELTAEEVQTEEGPVTLRISYRMEEKTPLLFVNLVLLPEDASLVTAEYAETLAFGGLNVLIGWALPGMDPAFGFPETFEMTADLHGKLPEWILSVGGSGLLIEAVQRMHPYFEEAEILVEDVQRVLKNWANGEDTPEIQTPQLREMLEQLTAENGTGAKEETEEENPFQAVHTAAGDLEKTAGTLEKKVQTLGEKAAGIEKQGQTLEKAQASLEAGAKTLEKDTTGLTGALKALLTHTGALDQLQAKLTLNATGVQGEAEKLKTSMSAFSTDAGTVSKAAASLAKTGKALAAETEKQSTQASEVKSGIDNLKTDNNSLKSGTDKLKTETNTAKEAAVSIESGIKTLSGSLQAVSVEGKGLTSEAEKLMADCLDASRQMLQFSLNVIGREVPVLDRETYGQILDELEASVTQEAVRLYAENKVRSTLLAEDNGQENALSNAETGIRKLVLEYVLATEGFDCTAEEYERKIRAGYVTSKTQKRIRDAVDTMMEDEEIVAAINEQADGQIEQTVDDRMASEEIQSQIEEMVKAVDIEFLRQEIRYTREKLNRMDVFATGISAYEQKTETLAADTAGLQTAAAKLATSSGTIAENASSLAELAASAAKQTETVQGAALSLSTGMTALVKTAKTVETDLNTLSSNAESVNTNGKELKTAAETLWTSTKGIVEDAGQLESDKTELSTDAASIQTAVTALVTDTGTMKVLLESCKTALQPFGEGISALKNEAGTASAQAATLTASATSMKSDLVQLEGFLTAQPEEEQNGFMPVAMSLLTFVEANLQNVLNLYGKTKVALGENTNYDLVPEGVTGDTIYIFRLNLQ